MKDGESDTDLVSCLAVAQLNIHPQTVTRKTYCTLHLLKKAFDRVPRKVVGHKTIEEWIVLRAGYVNNTRSRVRVNTYSDEFGVHQGSVLSPLLFVIVLEAIPHWDTLGAVVC